MPGRERLEGEGHKYKVTGETKIDGDKYPISCEIKDRHVTSVTYDGPEKEELSDAQKAAVGVAAVATAAVIAPKLKESKEEEVAVTSTGLKACRDAVGKKAEYRTVFVADIFVTAKTQDDANVEWRIETDKLNDWGTCQVSVEDEVLAVRTKQHEMK